MNKNYKEKDSKEGIFFVLSISLFLSVFVLCETSEFSLAFEPRALPPKVVMNISGLEIPGHLLAYEFRQGETFDQLNNPNESLSIKMPSTEMFAIGKLPKIIKLGLNDTTPISLDNESRLHFIVQNVSNNLSPESLYVTVYAINPIKPIKVFKINNSSQVPFKFNLESGSYILLGSLTWLPSSKEQVIGFAYYSWNIKLKD